jgi:hypothetical protein
LRFHCLCWGFTPQAAAIRAAKSSAAGGGGGGIPHRGGGGLGGSSSRNNECSDSSLGESSDSWSEGCSTCGCRGGRPRPLPRFALLPCCGVGVLAVALVRAMFDTVVARSAWLLCLFDDGNRLLWCFADRGYFLHDAAKCSARNDGAEDANCAIRGVLRRLSGLRTTLSWKVTRSADVSLQPFLSLFFFLSVPYCGAV